MNRSLCCFLLMLSSLSASAQTDSSAVGDTIGVYSQRGVLQTTRSYSYHGASQLANSQLHPVLRRSPDSVARKLFRQSRRQGWLSTGLLVGSVGLLLGSTERRGPQARPNESLILAGYGTLFGSFIPNSTSKRRLSQAIVSHNAYLRIRPDDYVPPIVYAPNQPWVLSLADTVALRRTGPTRDYVYRGISVYPTGQLGRITASLNDRDVNEGVRYVKTINQISGLVGGIGRGLLTSYATTLLLTRLYRPNAPVGNQLLTTSLLCIGANLVLNRHADGAQRRWVARYNDLLKQQFGSR